MEADLFFFFSSEVSLPERESFFDLIQKKSLNEQ